MENCRILGVFQPGSTVVYLNEILPATEAVLAMAAPARPTEVFRLAATCEEQRCSHFDGTDCRLATRIVQMLTGGCRHAAALYHSPRVPLVLEGGRGGVPAVSAGLDDDLRCLRAFTEGGRHGPDLRAKRSCMIT
jgi:hypothetical protein